MKICFIKTAYIATILQSKHFSVLLLCCPFSSSFAFSICLHFPRDVFVLLFHCVSMGTLKKLDEAESLCQGKRSSFIDILISLSFTSVPHSSLPTLKEEKRQHVSLTAWLQGLKLI